MSLTTNYINTDSNGNEYSQYETNDATVYAAQSRFTPQEKEAGRLLINYNAVNTATAAAVDKLKIVRYKKVSGVVSLIGATNIFNNADSGMSTADAAAAVSGGDIVINITGIAATTIRHTLVVERISSSLKQ